MAIEYHTARAREAKSNVPEKTDTTPLEDVIDQVRRDSVKNADEYLDETTVPHGGE